MIPRCRILGRPSDFWGWGGGDMDICGKKIVQQKLENKVRSATCGKNNSWND